MKKTFLTILLTTSLSIIYFGQLNSNLVIFSEDGNPFYVVVNGIKQNIEPHTNVKITGLVTPSNQIRILFKNEKIPHLDKEIYFLEMGVEATYKITKNKKKGYKLKYFDEIAINQAQINNNQWVTTYKNDPNLNITNSSNESVNSNTNNSSVNVNIQSSETSNIKNTSTQNIDINTNSNGGSTTISNTSSNGVELKYNWVAGTSHYFSAVVVDNINTSMMGMNIKEQIKTVTDFVFLVKDVAANGYATGTLYLINFKISDSQQNILASLNDIPKNLIQSEVTVDKKGNFTFLKKLFLISSSNSNVLAYGNEMDNSYQLNNQSGNLKVDAYLEFNPKIGTLKTGYNLKTIKTTKQVEITLNEESEIIDVIPYDFLELLVLPEGFISQGDNSNVKLGMYQTNITATSIQNGIAQLNTKFSTDKSADISGVKVQENSNSGSINMNMQGIESSQEIRLNTKEKEDIKTFKSVAPTMNCNINSNFDYLQGMFQNVSGTLNTTMDMMGMKINIQSVLEMKKM